jgi:hypothetical protein
MQRTTSAQTGRTEFSIIDGQQRIRAIKEFLEDGFPLSEMGEHSVAIELKGKRFSKLPEEMRQRLWNYDFVVQELSGYSAADIRDIFARFNRYVVRLSKQELRHAQQQGKFKEFVERIAKWPFWKQKKVFTASQIARLRPAELSAELAILLIEGGPQNRKNAIDLYYHQYSDRFSEGPSIEARLKAYFEWIEKALPNFETRRYRRSNELYALVGALDDASRSGALLSKIDPTTAGDRLISFEQKAQQKALKGEAARYVIAASKHTDDLEPRRTRTEILKAMLG